MLASICNYIPSIENISSYFSVTQQNELLPIKNNIEPQVPISGITKISWLQNLSAPRQLTGSMVLSPIYISSGTGPIICPPAVELLSAYGGAVSGNVESYVQVGDVFGVLIINNTDNNIEIQSNTSGGTGSITINSKKQQTIWFHITNNTPGSQSYVLLNVSN